MIIETNEIKTFYQQFLTQWNKLEEKGRVNSI